MTDYTVNPAPDSLLVMEDEIPTATSSPFRLSKHLHEMEQSPIHADVTPDQFEEMDIDQPSQRTSTPGLSTSTHRNPWDEDATPVLLQLQHCMATAPAYIQNALSTLDDRQWLCSDAIDESIQGILTSSSSQDVCLLCPTYIYQSVAMDSFDIAFTYLKRNDALNKDILIIPLNLDPQGKGTHWCLAVANFRVREIWIFDSMSNEANEGTLFIFSNLLWIVGAAYEIADTDFIRSSWRCIFSTNIQKQPNGFDCGVYTILNAYSLISKHSYSEICSNAVRQWLKVVILSACDNKRLLPACPKSRSRRKPIWKTI